MKIKHVGLMIVLCGAPAPGLAQEAPSTRIFELDKVHTAPVLLNPGAFAAARDSLYPTERRRRNRRATVETSFIIGQDGVPDSIQIVRSTDRAYNPASVAATGLLRFRPATVDGQPVAVRVQVVMRWTRYPPPSERESSWRRLLYGERRQTSSGAPIYETEDIQTFSRLPSPLNLQEVRQEMARQYPGIVAQGGRSTAEVMVWVVINGDGEIVDTGIQESTNPVFNGAAMNAVRTLRFEPVQMFGGPVHMVILVPIEWR